MALGFDGIGADGVSEREIESEVWATEDVEIILPPLHLPNQSQILVIDFQNEQMATVHSNPINEESDLKRIWTSVEEDLEEIFQLIRDHERMQYSVDMLNEEQRTSPTGWMVDFTH